MSALLALSDVAVMRALERAFSRSHTADTRAIAEREGVIRHDAYRRFPIGDARQHNALKDAWLWLPELVDRWMLPVDPDDWSAALDHYARELLSTRARHSLDGLEVTLRLLGAGHAV